MAKSQTAAATNDANSLINQAGSLTAPIISGLQQSNAGATANQASELGSATSGITAAQTTGGYNPQQLGTLQNETQNLATTGGYTPSQTAALNSGGYDPGTLSSIMGGYQNFANTGGYTPQQASQFMDQATSGTTATYNTLMQQAQQDQAKTGGLGTGGTLSQMARQLGQAQSSNTLNAEVALNSQENANKLSGLGGLASTESNVAGNTMAGMNSLASGIQQGTAQQAGLAGSVASGVTNANSQMSQLYDTTTGQITATGQQVLQALGLNLNSQSSAISALTSLSQNPSTLNRILTGMGIGQI